jgi:hypothetical protein
MLTAVLVTGVVASFALDVECESSVEPSMAWPRTVPWRLAVVPLGRRVGHWRVAALAQDERTRSGNYGRRRHVRVILDAALSTSPRSFRDRTAWAGDPNAVPTLAGHVFLPNLGVAAGFLAVTAPGVEYR